MKSLKNVNDPIDKYDAVNLKILENLKKKYEQNIQSLNLEYNKIKKENR